MDRENVINGIKEMSEHFFSLYHKETDMERRDRYYDEFRIIDNAVDLLKEQEPKQVNDIAQQISCFSGICPSCGKMLNTTCNKNFCGECGQEVKWE